MEPRAASGEARIPRPVTVIGSILNRSDATMLTMSTLGATSTALAPSEPGASSDGVPVKTSVVPTPAWSVRVTVKDPAASGIASTLGSVNRSARVVPEAPPRGTLPTAVTPTSPNTSWGVGTGVGGAVGAGRAVGGARGVGLGGGGGGTPHATAA